MDEEWRDIKGYEGLYQVSNLGRVKRISKLKSIDKGYVSKRDRMLKPGVRKDGYLFVGLSINNELKTYNIHRLVAMAFIENELKLEEVNHIDENKTNNEVNNLEWCTHEYNVNYGNRNYRAKKSLTNGKLSKKVVQFFHGVKVREYASIQEVKRIYGYNHAHISDCCNGKRTQAYGFQWKFASEVLK